MAELRDDGALGFTDDGRPVASAGLLRRALQYQRLCGGVIALHEEDPTLSGAGVMHEGEVSARARAGRHPAGVRVDDDRPRRRARRATRARASTSSTCQRVASVEAVAAREGGRRARHRRGHAAPPRAHRRRRARRSTPRLKMNPPLRTEADRQALIEGLRDGTIDCVATDHAPHAREEKEVPFEEAPMGTTGLETAFAGAPHRARGARACSASGCWSSA